MSGASALSSLAVVDDIELPSQIEQLFFSARVWKALPRPYAYIGIFCMVLTSIRCVASTLLGVEAILATSLDAFRIQWHWLITTLLTVGAAIDIIIAGAMLHFLIRKKGANLGR